MHTNTHVPPGGTAGERLPAPRQALSPYQHFETLGLFSLAIAFCTAPLVRLPRQALPSSCRGLVMLQWFFTRIMCVCWISCSTIPADICYLPAKQLHEDHGAGEPTSIASQISAPIGCADDGLDGSALSVSASFDVAGHLALYGNGHLARLGAGRGLAFVGL